MYSTLITNDEHRLFESLVQLYQTSFPIFEQRTKAQQRLAFASDRYRLLGYEERGTLVGFVSFWDLDGCIYIEHFAVQTTLRGSGYGSKILASFIASNDKTVLLEIDPPIDEISRARLRFYERLGFYPNPFAHTHPAYRTGYAPHPLVVLTTNGPIYEESYEQFYTMLRDRVMDFAPE